MVSGSGPRRISVSNASIAAISDADKVDVEDIEILGNPERLDGLRNSGTPLL
jgi:hypothetical protein